MCSQADHNQCQVIWLADAAFFDVEMGTSRKLITTLTDQLECCCPWVLWLDQTMLIRMVAHNLSIEAWLQSHQQEGDSGSPHAQKLLAEMSPWGEDVEEPVIGVVSTAGDVGHHGHFEVNATLAKL